MKQAVNLAKVVEAMFTPICCKFAENYPTFMQEATERSNLISPHVDVKEDFVSLGGCFN